MNAVPIWHDDTKESTNIDNGVSWCIDTVCIWHGDTVAHEILIQGQYGQPFFFRFQYSYAN